MLLDNDHVLLIFICHLSNVCLYLIMCIHMYIIKWNMMLVMNGYLCPPQLSDYYYQQLVCTLLFFCYVYNKPVNPLHSILTLGLVHTTAKAKSSGILPCVFLPTWMLLRSLYKGGPTQY